MKRVIAAACLFTLTLGSGFVCADPMSLSDIQHFKSQLDKGEISEDRIQKLCRQIIEYAPYGGIRDHHCSEIAVALSFPPNKDCDVVKEEVLKKYGDYLRNTFHKKCDGLPMPKGLENSP